MGGWVGQMPGVGGTDFQGWVSHGAGKRSTGHTGDNTVMIVVLWGDRPRSPRGAHVWNRRIIPSTPATDRTLRVNYIPIVKTNRKITDGVYTLPVDQAQEIGAMRKSQVTFPFWEESCDSEPRALPSSPISPGTASADGY